MAARITVVTALAAFLLLGAHRAEGWQNGRATFYGTDAWSIHKGSCMYGFLDRNVMTGWDITAISDVAPDYQGSCGKCKEVKCDARDFSDGYGAWLERRNVCYNTEASVVVMVTDTCPCTYPNNAYSNRRWCCGDLYHLDLSLWAYEKMADTKWGVIAVKWRDVSCDTRPRIAARRPDGGFTPMPDYYKLPSNWRRSMDKRLAGGKNMRNGR